MFFTVWIISIVLCGVIASSKKRDVAGWVVFGIISGPLAFIIILLLPEKKKEKEAHPISSLEMRRELDEIKRQFNVLASSIERLEARMGVSDESKKLPEMPLSPGQKAAVQETPQPEQVKAVAARKDIEVDVGRYWLNRIGIIIFALGIGFLISYTFKYFGALAKIIFGYAVSAGLFYAGRRLGTKEKYVNYGRVLYGGGWAIAYFTTYAMYHFDASRIISSQLLDLVLLGVVACGIIMHALRYQSQTLAIIALFVGYLTATIGNITYFTLLTCLVLAVAATVLMYRQRWVKIIFFGIACTYLVHVIWVIKQIYFSIVEVGTLNVEQVYLLMHLGFLFLYWAVFTLGIHFIREREDESLSQKLAAANYCNFLLFFFLAYPKLYTVYPQFRVSFLVACGVVYLAIAFLMGRLKRLTLLASNLLIAASALTLAVPFKFMRFHTDVIWLIELPFLVYVGIYFRQRVLRYFSVALALVLFFKYISYDFSLRLMYISIFGYMMSWVKFLSLLGVVSMGFCYGITKRLAGAQETAADVAEKQLYYLFSALAAVYLTMSVWMFVPLQWLTIGVTLEMVALFACGVISSDSILRAYAIVPFCIAAFRFCGIDTYYMISEITKWCVVTGELVIMYLMYFSAKGLREKGFLKSWERYFETLLFYGATILSTVAVYRYVDSHWISLALGIEGIVLFLIGFVSKTKMFRIAGFVIFALTLLRVVFVDMAMLNVIYKIISFIILGLLFLVVSFIYTNYNTSKTKE